MKELLTRVVKNWVASLLVVVLLLVLLVPLTPALAQTATVTMTFYPKTVAEQVWLGAAGEDKAFALAEDGNFVYLALWTDPAQLIKISKDTMATVAKWTGNAGEGYCHALIIVDGFAYVGLHAANLGAAFPGIIYKLSALDLSEVDFWEGAVGEDNVHGMTSDTDYIYAAMNCRPTGKVIKLDKATLTTQDVWTGGGNDDSSQHTMVQIVEDTNYVYSLKYTADGPGSAYKIQKSDMTEVDSWVGGVGYTNAYGLGSDADYLYTAHNLDPGRMVKIQKSDMSEVDTWTGAAGQSALLWAVVDGSYVYVSGQSSPFKLLKLDTATLTTQAVHTGAATENQAHALAIDSDYAYVGLNINPARVVKVAKSLVLSVDGYTEHIVGSPGVAWSTLRAAAGTGSLDNDPAGRAMYIMGNSVFANYWYGMRRGIVVFDTSLVPAGAIITSATLSVYGYLKGDDLVIAPDINVYSASPASDTALASGDFDSIGSVALCDTPITYAGFSTAGYNAFALNAAGLAAIDPSGATAIGFRNANYDVANVEPAKTAVGTKTSYLQFYGVEQGAAFAPKLVVTFVVGDGPPTVSTSAAGGPNLEFLYPVVVSVWLGLCIGLVFILASNEQMLVAVILGATMLLLTSAGVRIIVTVISSALGG